MSFASVLELAHTQADAGDYKNAGRSVLEAASLAHDRDECDALIALCNDAEPKAGILNRGRFKSARQLADERKTSLAAVPH